MNFVVAPIVACILAAYALSATPIQFNSKESSTAHSISEEPKVQNKILALEKAPGFIYAIEPAQAEDKNPTLFHIVTSNTFPHYVTYNEAKDLCLSLKGLWRLPQLNELQKLHKAIKGQLTLETNGRRTQLSRGPYWTDQMIGSKYTTITMTYGEMSISMNKTDLRGVICVSES